jgi:hypothetical protein
LIRSPKLYTTLLLWLLSELFERLPEVGDPESQGSSILLGSTGPRGGKREGLLEAAAKSAARSVGSGFGRAILRGALGSILGTGRSRRLR